MRLGIGTRCPRCSGLSALPPGDVRDDAGIILRRRLTEMCKHVLVALDQSAYSQTALPTAIEAAKKFGADLFVLHMSEHDRGRAAVFSMESPAEATKLVVDAVKIAREAGIAAKGEGVDAAAGHVAQ